MECMAKFYLQAKVDASITKGSAFAIRPFSPGESESSSFSEQEPRLPETKRPAFASPKRAMLKNHGCRYFSPQRPRSGCHQAVPRRSPALLTFP